MIQFNLVDETRLGCTRAGEWSLHSIDGCEVAVIGHSRARRQLYGLRCGDGPLRVSITAGAHADEPVGPRAAIALACALAQPREEWSRELHERCSFWIVPHMNPDGDAENALWQHARGDVAAYLKSVVREPPGDDVEFNYPRDESDRATRPENLAAADFFRAAGGPFDLHLSLHSMGFAAGAWFLVCREWAERARTRGMFEKLANAAGLEGMGLHDVERHGEKGFTRLAPGFCTTPRSDAMREFFLAQGDASTAALFRPSSMEFIKSLGGDPLCMVSEIPYFEIRAGREVDSLERGELYNRLREVLPMIKAALLKGDDGPLKEAMARYEVVLVSWEAQARLQIRMVMEGVRAVGCQRGNY